MTGPYETEAQARAAVARVYDAARASSRRGVLTEGSHRLLCDALSAAGVEADAYDHRILLWLAGWSPEVCAVVAGLVGRASAGQASGG